MQRHFPLRSIRGLLPLMLLGVTFVIYAPLLSFPYAVDDWGMLRSLTFTPPGQFLLDAFNPTGKLFYRPLAAAYFAGLYALCGLCPMVFHVLAFVALAAAAFLVVDIGQRLTGSDVAGWGAGFLFATASTIHLDPQMWLVGGYEIGALLFGLISVSLVLRERYTASAASLAAALGCKEVAVALPFILVLLWLAVRSSYNKHTWYELWLRFRIHLGVLGIYALAKAAGILLLALPTLHPYARRTTFANVLDSARLYAFWSLEALAPMKNVPLAGRWILMIGGFVILVSALILLVAVFRATISGTSVSRESRIVLALASWIGMVVLLPVLFGSMLNKYYLLTAVPPLALGSMVMLRSFAPSPPGRVVFPLLVFLLVIANSIDGALLVARKVRLGLRDGEHASSWGGETHLVRKAEVVRLVWKPLLSLVRSVPPRSIFIFPGIETRAFADADGLQTWYGDSTLRVAEIMPNIPVIDGRITLLLSRKDPGNVEEKRAVVTVPQENVFAFRLSSDSLIPTPLHELLSEQGNLTDSLRSPSRRKVPSP